MSKHQSDSSEQQSAKGILLQSLEKQLGLTFSPEAKLPSELGVKPDGVDPANQVVV